MAQRTRKAIGWVSILGTGIAVSIVAVVLLGAADQTDEVLQIDVGAWIYYYTPSSDIHDSSGIQPVRLFLAVTSPTRGAVEQLRSGNVRVLDAIYGLGGELEDPHGAETVEVVRFANLGGGFYQVDVAPYYKWNPHQYVLRIEIECPWGRGITVCELPMGSSDIYQ